MICWKCKESIQSPVCVGCGAIQPPPANPDFFAIFGLPRSFFIADVAKKYRSLSRMLHPDRFVKKSAVERRMSLLWTASVNEAKRCLEDPILRARYLATGSSRVQEDRRLTLSPEFLEHIFDLQMAAMESPEIVQQQAQQEYEQEFAKLEAIFRSWEKDQDALHLQKVEIVLARLKYLNNLKQSKG